MRKKSMRLKCIGVTTICLLLFAGTPVRNSEPVDKTGLKDMIQSVGRDVGRPHALFADSHTSPVVILEELHDSRIGQIEQAIMLLRLYHRYSLRQIALEGHLFEHPEIRSDWFERAAAGHFTTKVTVAVQLLKEGEISSAEFIKLLYDDVILLPIEKADNYNVKLSSEANNAPSQYLLSIALTSIRKAQLTELNRLLADAESAEEAQKPKKYKKTYNYIMSNDPWCQAMEKRLLSTESLHSMSLDARLAAVEEIKARAEARGLTMSSRYKTGMAAYVDFLQKRRDTEGTMVSATAKTAVRHPGRPMAMIVGAAHTHNICKLLRQKRITHVVITPRASEHPDHPSDLNLEQFDRKYLRRSVVTTGLLSEILNRQFPPAAEKKPEPVMMEPWLQAKSELYLFIHRIVQRRLSRGAPPLPKSRGLSVSRGGPSGGGGSGDGGGPPGSPPIYRNDDDDDRNDDDDEMKGKYTKIDPDSIEIVAAGPSGDERAVLFKALITQPKTRQSTALWIKAALATSDFVPNRVSEEKAAEFIEAMLKEALNEVRTKKTKNKKGPVMTQAKMDMVVCYSTNREDARKTDISSK